MPRYRVGTDIGGTFTDLIVIDIETGQYRIGKTLTTPEDPSLGIETVFQRTLNELGIDPSQVENVIHGTTLVTNAMIERKGATTAVLATAGFRDALEIGKESRFDLYDLQLQKPLPLVPRYLRFDIPQRTAANGDSLQPLDEDRVRQLAQEFSAKGITAVAVCFLHSFTNPTDERRARALLLQEASELRVSISSEVVPEIREFERTSTTVANVYVQELVERYLGQLQQRLARIGFQGSFYLMLSGGGIATLETAARFPVRLLESGPAAGALAANWSGKALGHDQLISFDMGGTTAKICVIDQGSPLLAHEFEVDRRYRFKKGSGLPIKLPVIELIEIGTGGGSIAHVDSLGLLKIGPHSAGADPGPACYGRGGQEPTVTDANLILGYLDPAWFLGGEMPLDLQASRTAVENRIAKPLGISTEQAAWGIHQIANENMANAARVHALERGKDPGQFPLFAFGGAGPVHAHRIALALGSPRWVAPLGAGVMSTVGFLTAPLSFDFVRTWSIRLPELTLQLATRLFTEMELEGSALLKESGMAGQQIRHVHHVDMRYAGQGHEIRVSFPNHDTIGSDAALQAALEQAFESVYRQLYERIGPPVDVEIVNWRVTSSGPMPHVFLTTPEPPQVQSINDALKGHRPAWNPGAQKFEPVAVYDRYRLLPGFQFEGPAIVEERESTVVIGSEGHCEVDSGYNLVIDCGASRGH